MHFLFELSHNELFLHSEKVGHQGFCVFVINLLYGLGFGNVGNHVIEVVYQIESKKLLQKVVLHLGKHVDVALLAVPCF